MQFNIQKEGCNKPSLKTQSREVDAAVPSSNISTCQYRDCLAQSK